MEDLKTENKEVLDEAEIEEIHDEACDRVPPLDDDYDEGTFDWKWKMKFAQLAAKKGQDKLLSINGTEREMAEKIAKGIPQATISYLEWATRSAQLGIIVGAKAERERILEILNMWKETTIKGDNYERQIGRIRAFEEIERLLGD